MADTTRAQELTNALLEWLRSEHPMEVIPALLVAAAKIAAASGESEERLEQMLALLRVAFDESVAFEQEKKRLLSS